MKINRNNKYRAFVMGTFGVFAMLGGLMVYSSDIANVSACTAGEGQVCDSTTTDVKVQIHESLSITSTTVDGVSTTTINVGDSVSPDTLASKAMVVKVASNYANGYYLKLNGLSKDGSTATALTHTNGTSKIATLGTGTFTAANFAAGAWGFSAPCNGVDASNNCVTLGSGNYVAIPATATTIDKYAGPTDGNATTFTVGVKPSIENPAGTYTGYLQLTAVPNV